MTLEELQEQFEAFKESAATEAADLKGQIQAVLKNRDEILTERKQDRDKAKELEALVASLKEGSAPKSKDRKDDTGADDERIAKLVAEQTKDLREMLEREQKEKRELALRTSLDDALTANNVSPALRDAAKALIRTGQSIDHTDDGVTVSGMPVNEFVKSWVDTEAGKPFIAATHHKGGGASQGVATGGQPEKTKTRSEMTKAEKGAYTKEHGVEAYLKLPL